jgi:tRNA 5-methylaminomethyl-2-thiouridine biosynthesis bifunctional protein
VNSPITWGPDGTPRSALFDDVYRSCGLQGQDQGWLQAQQVFLQGCGLWSPKGGALAWQGHRQWHVLETGFGLGLGFLATWHAWQQDADRPDRLFFTSVEAWPVAPDDILRSVQAWPFLQPLALALTRHWRGLLPGVHRLVLEGGRVHLTLCIGPVDRMLREVDVAADSVFLDGFSPSVNPQMWSQHTLKSVARLCRPGTGLASWCVRRSVREDLAQCGFRVSKAPGLPPKLHRLVAVFQPHWTPRSPLRAALHSTPERSALVLGAGLSGSAVACSLARRGWSVTVLDAGMGVGAGASGLPVGLVVPHVSPDDSVLSRITRAGVRATLERCEELLETGTDWDPCGVLEHQVEGKRRLPAADAWPEAGHAWSTPASIDRIKDAQLPDHAQALWHPMAAWVRPSCLVTAQLSTPGIQLQWRARVHALRPVRDGWQVCDQQGQVLAQAPQLILAGGYDTRALLQDLISQSPRSDQNPVWDGLPLHPLRGQVSMGSLGKGNKDLRAISPRFPVNGHGSFITGIPLPPPFSNEPGWYAGSTFERDCCEAVVRADDHAVNQRKLARLLPGLSQAMAQAFAPDRVMAWAGVRCTLPDRLPALGQVDGPQWPGLHLCTGMGARGISLSVLGGESIAAQLEGEPWPLSAALARHLRADRFRRS